MFVHAVDASELARNTIVTFHVVWTMAQFVVNGLVFFMVCTMYPKCHKINFIFCSPCVCPAENFYNNTSIISNTCQTVIQQCFMGFLYIQIKGDGNCMFNAMLEEIPI